MLFPGLPIKNLGINRNLILVLSLLFLLNQLTAYITEPQTKEGGNGLTAFALGVLRASLLAQRRVPATLQTKLEWQEIRTGQKRSREGPCSPPWVAHPSPAPLLPSPPVMEQPGCAHLKGGLHQVTWEPTLKPH